MPGESLFVGVAVPPGPARQLAVPGGEPPADLHITLFISDEGPLDPGAVAEAIDALRALARHQPPLWGVVNGAGYFANASDGHDALFATPDVPGLAALHDAVTAACESAGIVPALDHGWIPHITLQYARPDAPHVALERRAPVTLRLDTLQVRGPDGLALDLPLSWRLAASA